MTTPIGNPSPRLSGRAARTRDPGPAPAPGARHQVARAMDRDRAEFGRRDLDGDGLLSRRDLGRGRESRLALRGADFDGDRQVSFAEFRAVGRIQRMQRLQEREAVAQRVLPQAQTPPPTVGAPPAPGAVDQAAPASPHTAHLLGAMSAAQIEQVLTDRGSRMAGQGYGEVILAMERKYGVPAVQFLAQATMESQIGGDDGYAQPGFNVGNIRPGDYWDGPVVNGPYGEFRVYESWEQGVEDYFKLLASPIYAGKSLQDQVFTYAPPSDGNDSWHYLDQVQKLILQWSGLSA